MERKFTDKESFVAGELRRIVEVSEARVGALVLTFAPLPGMGDVRMANAILMKGAAPELAPDLTFLPRRLREMADELEDMIANKRPPRAVWKPWRAVWKP